MTRGPGNRESARMLKLQLEADRRPERNLCLEAKLLAVVGSV